MKPIYKHIFDLENFFNFLYIEIIGYTVEDCYGDNVITSENRMEFTLSLDKLPGVYIYINNLKASFDGQILNNGEFYSFIINMINNVLNELKQNIATSNSYNELKKYFKKLRLVIDNIDVRFIEINADKSQGQIKIRYIYESSNVNTQVSKNINESYAEIFLSDLLHWIRDRIRSLYLSANVDISTIKPFNIAVKMVTSFEFTKPKYYPSKLSFIFNDLRDSKLIDQTTSPEQLEHTFKNVIIHDPIKWIAGEACLYYFIKQLIKKGIVIDPKKKIWIKTVACFVDENGSRFETTNLRGSKKNKTASQIEYIVRKFQL
jgi:hypothetical protein